MIAVLNAAGFKTYWLSNQSSGTGWDIAVTLLSQSASEHRWVRKGGANNGLSFTSGALRGKIAATANPEFGRHYRRKGIARNR